jgi:hypothetical protein
MKRREEKEGKCERKRKKRERKRDYSKWKGKTNAK